MSACPFTVLFALLLLTGLARSSTTVSTITGSTVLDPYERSVSLQVWVHSESGQLLESAAVAPDGSFTFYSLPSHSDGIYVLSLDGTTVDEYATILVSLQKGDVVSALPRTEPLMIPPRLGTSAWPASADIKFVPIKKTNYAKKPAPWRLKDIWRHKFRIFQLLAVVFVVWFPHFIRELPKDLREELMGEKDADIGDPNAVVKSLLDWTDSGSSPATVQT